jgi:hypothetical protein
VRESYRRRAPRAIGAVVAIKKVFARLDRRDYRNRSAADLRESAQTAHAHLEEMVFLGFR